LVRVASFLARDAKITRPIVSINLSQNRIASLFFAYNIPRSEVDSLITTVIW